MKDIHLYFCDFWETFNKQNNIFIGALSLFYNVIIDSVPNKANLIICSCFSKEHYNYVGKKKILYFSGENDFPNYISYDYAVTHIDMQFSRHLRIPLWVVYNYDNIINKNLNIENFKTSSNDLFKRRFCCDVISNTFSAWQTRFVLSDQLDQYKKLDHGGSYKNNIGGKVPDKLAFLSKYKFSIASENSIIDGYVTEKIYESFIAKTIPIYLGTDYVIKDFNKDAFINVRDYKTFSDLINKVREIDNDEDLYMKMLNAYPLAKENLYSEYFNKLAEFLRDIIENGSIMQHKFGRQGLYASRIYGIN